MKLSTCRSGSTFLSLFLNYSFEDEAPFQLDGDIDPSVFSQKQHPIHSNSNMMEGGDVDYIGREQTLLPSTEEDKASTLQDLLDLLPTPASQASELLCSMDHMDMERQKDTPYVSSDSDADEDKEIEDIL